MMGPFCGHPTRLRLALIVVSLSSPAAAQSSALQNLHSGNGLLQRGMYDLAGREYRAFLKENADHEDAPVARYGLAVCYFKKQDYDRAEKQLGQLEGQRFAYAAEVLTMLGQCRLVREDYSGACEAFGRVLGEHGDHKLAPDAAAQFSEALYRGERLKEAVGCCQRFAEKWPDHPLRARVEYFAGLAEIKLGEDQGAADRIDRLLTRVAPAPITRHAALLAAQCRHRLGDQKRAAARYESVVADADNPYRGDALYGLGVLRLQGGDASGASELFRAYLGDVAPGAQRAAVLLNLGRCLFDLEQYDESAAHLEKAGEADPALADEAAYWSAKGQLRRGDFDEAARRLERAATAHPDSRLLAEMTYDRGVALFRAGNYGDAGAVLQRFLERHEDHTMTADALELLAVCLHRKGDYDAATKACRRFLARYKDHALKASVTFLLAENAYLSGAFEEAAEEYKRFLQRFSKDERGPTAVYRLGMALHRLKRFDEASAYLAKAVEGAEAEPAFRSARFALGDVAFEQSDWKRAGELLAEYIKSPPEGAALDEALIKLGLCRQRRGDPAGAIACYDRILAEFGKGPHAMQALFEKGQALLAAGKLKDAEAVFKLVIEKDAESHFAPFARNHLGQLALKRGEFDRAAEFLAEVDDAKVDGAVAADALFRRGQALMAAGDYKSASTSFARFLKKHDEHALAATAAVQRAICIARDGHPQRAVKLFDEADWKRIDPAVGDAARYEWGWCLKSLGRNDDAATVFTNLVDAPEPGSPHLHAMLELADLESAAGGYDRAAVLLERICKLGNEGSSVAVPAILEQAAYRLGLCAFERGDHEKAADALGQFIKQYPHGASIVSANALCGESLFQVGNHAKAAGCFQRVIEGGTEEAATAAAWLRMGESYAAMQKWTQSEEAFAAYLDRFADAASWYQAAFGLGWARENQGRHDEAMASYRDVVERHKGPTAARAQFQIGECLFARKQYEEAAGALLKVDILYAYPEWSAAALFEAGRCFEKLAKLVEARQQFQRVVERHGETEWAKMARARLEETSVAGLPGR